MSAMDFIADLFRGWPKRQLFYAALAGLTAGCLLARLSR
jgi:hypothetical protein